MFCMYSQKKSLDAQTKEGEKVTKEKRFQKKKDKNSIKNSRITSRAFCYSRELEHFS